MTTLNLYFKYFPQAIILLLLNTIFLRLAVANEIQDHYASYDINIDRSLNDMHVKACFMKSIPESLQANNNDASRRLQTVQINGEGSYFKKVNSNRISLKDLKKGECINYVVNIESSSRRSRRAWFRQRNPSDDSVRISPSSWLWLPERENVSGDIVMTFTHPEDYSVSTSWPLVERSAEKTTFLLGDTPYRWNTYTVIGDIHIEEISVPGSVLRLAIMKGKPEANVVDVREWIAHGAEAITLAYGRFPLPSPQIVVNPTGASRRDAVRFGHVLRGGGTSSHLYIDQTRPVSEHINDWTLTHELSHMMHPYMGNAGSWMAEGLASYYQNVLQARIGTITPHRAWQKLHEGFERGLKQTYDGVTLEDASTNRGRNGTMRVYWSGAAITLLADLELRKRGDTLDNALSRFQSCCLPAKELWRPLDFLHKLDELSNTSIFLDLYNDYVMSDEFPDLDDAYKRLGIYIIDGNVTFTNNPEARRLRESIMNRPAKFKQVMLDKAISHYYH